MKAFFVELMNIKVCSFLRKHSQW